MIVHRMRAAFRRLLASSRARRSTPWAPGSGSAGAQPSGTVGARSWLRRAQLLAQRHPRWVDAGLAALLALVDGPGALDARAGVDAWLWFAAVHLPLVWRRRAPVTVFWAVFGLALVAGAVVGVRVEGVYPEAVIAVAVYTVARYGPRRHLWPVVAAIELPAAAVLLWNGPNWTALAFVTAVLAATVLLGITVSTRQAYLAGLEERAQRLERERDQYNAAAQILRGLPEPEPAERGRFPQRRQVDRESGESPSRRSSPPRPSGPASPAICTTSWRTTWP